jgi:hypothetical protein
MGLVRSAKIKTSHQNFRKTTIVLCCLTRKIYVPTIRSVVLNVLVVSLLLLSWISLCSYVPTIQWSWIRYSGRLATIYEPIKLWNENGGHYYQTNINVTCQPRRWSQYENQWTCDTVLLIGDLDHTIVAPVYKYRHYFLEKIYIVLHYVNYHGEYSSYQTICSAKHLTKPMWNNLPRWNSHRLIITLLQVYQDAREDSSPTSYSPPSQLLFPPHVFAHSHLTCHHHYNSDLIFFSQRKSPHFHL